MEGKTVVCEDCGEVIEEDEAYWTHDYRFHTGNNECFCKVCWQIRNID